MLFQFPSRHEVLSWAIVGGGRTRASCVAWYQVGAGELRPPVDPQEFLQRKLREAGVSDAVGFLTSRDLDACVDCERRDGGYWARSIATVGLSNSLRVGDPCLQASGIRGKIGTINLLCQVSHPLTEEAFLEAMAIAVEARTTAILDAAVPSSITKEAATGTGTDCVVMAAPPPGGEMNSGPERYAGKHTLLGHLIGGVVLDAISRGAREWQSQDLKL